MEENRMQEAGAVDLEAVAQTAQRLGRKKALAVARDMLRQQGLDEAAAAEALSGLSGVMAPDDEQRALEELVEALRAENEGMRRRMLAVEQGIPAARAARYVQLAGSYPEAAESFEQALALALEEFPVAGAGAGTPEAPPSFAAKTTAPPAQMPLTQGQIEAMSPGEITARWGEVERFLETQQKES